MVTERIAIIPARGGSKRIPRKNITEFCGKPLIYWTIKAALESGLFAQVLVSTDDREIAEISRASGAAVPFLRTQAQDDYTPVSVATLHALDQAQDHWSKKFDTVVQLMPNCPLRQSSDIKVALHNYELVGVEFQISCCRFGWLNPWWAVRLEDDMRPRRLFENTLGKRSQDLEALYCPTGAIWIAKAEALRKAGTFYGAGHIFHPMSWTAAVDIDDEADFAMALAVSNLPMYKNIFHG